MEASYSVAETEASAQDSRQVPSRKPQGSSGDGQSGQDHSILRAEKMPKGAKKELNYEAVIINMNKKYFKACEKLLLEDYNLNWLDNYIKALMNGRHKDEIAVDWAKDDRRMKTACFILGALVDGGVLGDSYADIAKAIFEGKEKGEKKEKKLRTLANYIGQGKKQALGRWTKEYIEGK